MDLSTAAFQHFAWTLYQAGVLTESQYREVFEGFEVLSGMEVVPPPRPWVDDRADG